MADAADSRALLLTIQANTELLRSNLTAAERAVKEFTDHTQEHLDKSDGHFALLGKSVERLEGPLERLKAIGEAAFTFFIGESLIEKGKQALEFAGSIEALSEQIGVSTDFLQKFRFAATESSASLEAADTGLTKFSRSVGEAANGNKGVIKTFDDLKVHVLDASGKVRSVEAVYLDVAAAIAAIPDPAQRTADTLALFGRGAATLIPLLNRGATGFNELAAAGEQLGVVISPDLIEHAEDVNHKLAALKLILDAQMASAVAQNAGAIAELGDSFLEMIPKIEQAFSKVRDFYHQFQLFDARARQIAPFGTQETQWQGVKDEALAKYNIQHDRVSDALGNANPKIRQDILRMWPSEFAKSFGYSEPQPEHHLGSTGAGASNPDTSHHKSGDQLAREVEARRQKALEEDRAFEGQLRSAQLAYNKAEAELADTAEAQLAVHLESLQDSLKERDAQLDSLVDAGKMTAARRDELEAIYRKTELDEEELAKRKAQARLIDEKAAADRQSLDGQIALLNLDDHLATTRKERLKIELQLLDLQERQAKIEQQKIIDSPTSTAAPRAAAQTTIGQIDAQHGRNVQTVKDQNLDPVQAYSKQLHAATDDMNDALKSVEVNGLQSLQDGLLGVISGTESVGSAFKKMADQIITDLLRIQIEKAIVGFLGNIGGALSGGGGDFGGGGASGGFADGGIPRYDGGGKIVGPGTGRSDSILAILNNGKPIRVSNGEFIMNAQATHDNLDLLEALNSGRMPAFANGGVTAPRIPRSMHGYGGGATVVQLNTNVQMVGTTSDDVASLRAELARRDAALPSQIIATVADARGRRILPA